MRKERDTFCWTRCLWFPHAQSRTEGPVQVRPIVSLSSMSDDSAHASGETLMSGSTREGFEGCEGFLGRFEEAANELQSLFRPQFALKKRVDLDAENMRSPKSKADQLEQVLDDGDRNHRLAEVRRYKETGRMCCCQRRPLVVSTLNALVHFTPEGHTVGPMSRSKSSSGMLNLLNLDIKEDARRLSSLD